jgi:hypothetical protein
MSFFGMAAAVKKAADAQMMAGKALRDPFKPVPRSKPRAARLEGHQTARASNKYKWIATPPVQARATSIFIL